MYLSLFAQLLFLTEITGFHVQGHADPLVTQLGATVLLPCFTQSPLPLEGLEVEWRKTDSESLVNIFQKGKTRPELQSEDFKDRVYFFPDEIAKGNFSILLKNVEKNDTGHYRCKVSMMQDFSETLVEIKNTEHLVITGADHAVFASVGDEVILNCSVDSHVPVHEIEEVTWKRTNQEILILLYQDNQIFSDTSHESYRGRAEFFVNEIPKGNFSLKLKDVKIEDKGEYTCEVHTSHMSAHTIVTLDRLGFSLFHILILVLCLLVLLIAVGLGVPVFILLRKKVPSGKPMKMNAFLILFPNLCMCAAFILWSTEGFLSEVLICSAVSIIRPLVLLKTSPDLESFPERFAKAVKTLGFPIYHSVITIAICTSFFYNVSWKTMTAEHFFTVLGGFTGAAVTFTSAIILAGYSLQIHSTVCLVICNVAVLGVMVIQSSDKFEHRVHLTAAAAPLIIGILIFLSLLNHYFQEKPFECTHIVLSSIIVTLFTLTQICIYIRLSIKYGHFLKAWIILFEALLYIVAWISVVFLVRRHTFIKGCCSQYRGMGYLCCAIIAAFVMTGYGAVCLHYIGTYLNFKDHVSYLAMAAHTHILATASHFQHPRNIPYLPHIIFYMFGAVGLNVVNSIILVTELNLKTGTGARTVEDLRMFVLPFETIFVSGWLALVIYVWMRKRHRIRKNFQDERVEAPQEMEALSAPIDKPCDLLVCDRITFKEN